MADPEGVQASSAQQALASKVQLAPYESASYESGGLPLDKIVRFATVDCLKVGWLVKEKGIWSIADEGRKAYAELTDPESFYKRMQALFEVVRSAAGC